MLFAERIKRASRLALVAGFCLLLPTLMREERALSQGAQFSPVQAPPNARYVGAQTCALCHDEHARSYSQNAMARALETPAESQVLREHPKLEFKLGKYNYRIERKGSESFYTVTDGAKTISLPIDWAFGQGKMGQTYVLRYNDRFYESRVSFYPDTNNLDLTLGSPSEAPRTLEEALGRPMQSADTKDCFGCHAQAAVSQAKLQLDKLVPGVTCESCHGPGAEHVALAKAGKTNEVKNKGIFNPAHLSPYDLSQQFCGACHRSWEQVSLMGLRGVGNVRFQPYRITYSPCYNPDDRRISCTACHDPHKAVAHDVAAYDVKCLACHQTSVASVATAAQAKDATARACKVGTQKCASCHMPKYELPGSHFRFADHLIRVVKPNELYPN
jgi:hypothetical protein